MTARPARIVQVISSEELRSHPDQIVDNCVLKPGDPLPAWGDGLEKDDIIRLHSVYWFYDEWLAGDSGCYYLYVRIERMRGPGALARYIDILKRESCCHCELPLTSPEAAELAPYLRPRDSWFRYVFSFSGGECDRVARVDFSELPMHYARFDRTTKFAAEYLVKQCDELDRLLRRVICIVPTSLYAQFMNFKVWLSGIDVPWGSLPTTRILPTNSVRYGKRVYRALYPTSVWEMTFYAEDFERAMQHIRDAPPFVGESLIAMWTLPIEREIYIESYGASLVLNDRSTSWRGWTWPRIHEVVLDTAIAFDALDLPPYVLLEIVDWLPVVYRHKHGRKIALIVAVRESARRIRAARAIPMSIGERVRRRRLENK